MTGCSGWGRDRNRQELARLLEMANINLAKSRELIKQIFERDSAADLSTRVCRLQEQIRELKQLVKQ